MDGLSVGMRVAPVARRCLWVVLVLRLAMSPVAFLLGQRAIVA